MIWRYRLVFFFLLFSFAVILLRLFYWQVVKADELTTLGQSQYGAIINIPSIRGEIRTSDNFPLATNKIAYFVYANPKVVSEKDKTTTLLAPILSADPASISALLSSDHLWVPVKDRVTDEQKLHIESYHLPGIGFEQTSQRMYPESSIAAQLLGIVGKDANGNDQGYFGLEGYYDRLLKGTPIVIRQIHDAVGKPILAKMDDVTVKVDGSNLVISIDRTLQFIAEEKIKTGVEKYGATSGMVGIMDPKTGNMLAMAAYPAFDPATYQDYAENLFKNPFVTNTYEPGSTFKPLVMSAALDAKLLKPDTKCPICAGSVPVSGYEIHTWDDKYFPNETMTEVIQHSDNTGMVYVAQTLGLDRMLSYLTQFGIGDTTGIDLQGEVSVPLRAPNQWYAVDLATTGFGQGISITPIELLSAFSAIANGGDRMQPHIVKKVISPDGAEVNIDPKVLSNPISSAASKVMTEMLVNAVNNGEAKWTRLKGYRIAGKTGTASIPIAGHYDPSKTIASFIGYGPAENPKFLMLVIIDRPTTSIYGAETAAPIFFDIAHDIMSYDNIPPSE